MSHFKCSLYLTKQKHSETRCTLRRLRNHVPHFALVCLSLAAIVTAGCGVTSQAQNSTATTAIKSISPTNVVAGGPGFSLVVSGTGFTTDSVVTVNNQVRTTTFISATQLKAVILASDIGNPGQKPLSVFNVHSFVPAFDSAALNVQPSTSSQGSTLAITTTGLPTGAVGVSYSTALSAANGVPPYTWGVASGQLPPGLNLQASTGQISGTPSQAGTFAVTVQVTDSSSQSTSAGFSANIAPQSSPVVTSVTPNTGPTAGGTSVTINGANFLIGANVSFGGTIASSPTVTSSTQIRAVTPGHLAGNADVIVQNPNGEASTLNNGFVYNVPSPTVASVSPNAGPTTGGTRVTITGTNFLAGALILFGTAPATSVVVNSATQIQATTPAHAAGLAEVTVQDPGNVSANLASGFTYNSSTSGPPTITNVSPTSGAPGTRVTITGTNFTSGASVVFGSTNSVSTTFVSPTEIVSSVPTVGTGIYSVTVTVPEPASATLNNGFTVTAAPPAQSLLSGCTVNPSNQPNCSIPSGWTLVKAEGFDSGNLGPNETIDQSASITTNNAHTGSYSMQGHYGGDGDRVSWFLNQGTIGNVSELYISYWDYADPNAKYGNSDYFLVDIVDHNACGGLGQDYGYDAQDFTGSLAPVSTSTMMGVSQGPVNTAGCQGLYQYKTGANLPMNAGVWRQVEIHYKPSTSGSLPTSGSVPNCNNLSPSANGCGDGEAELYINGQLKSQQLNANLNGTQSMSGTSIEVGGTITDFCDQNGTRAVPFSMCPANAPTPFNRYIDDIVIMKK